MDAEFDRLEEGLREALAALSPPRRKALMRDIGLTLRRRNQVRIERQVDPDGAKWAPRAKPKSRRPTIKARLKMMRGLRQARRMVLKADADGLELGYAGRDARIALIHQEGRSDRPAPMARKIRYPIRRLLGVPDSDHDLIRDRVIDHLAEAFDP